MEKHNITLGGMTNVPDDIICNDGDMQMLLNLRHEGGELTQMKRPTVENKAATVLYAKIHATADTWLEVMKYNNKYYLTNGKAGGFVTPDHATAMLYESEVEITGLDVMGNIVMVYRKNKRPVYLIWEGEAYRVAGELPALPIPAIKVNSDRVVITTDTSYYNDEKLTDTENPDSEQLWSNVSKGYYDRCISVLAGRGMFIDRTLVRVAARLFDGSYLDLSGIMCVQDSIKTQQVDLDMYQDYSVGRDNKNFIAIPSNTGKRCHFVVAVKGFKMEFAFPEYDLSSWENIIMGIDVFATPSIMGHKATNKVETSSYKTISYKNVWARVEQTTSGAYDRYAERSASDIKDEMENADLFYKIAEYDLKGKKVWEIESVLPSEMAVQDSLPIGESLHTIINSTTNSIYNGKMHSGGITEKLHDAYSMSPVDANEVIKQITAIVKIDTDEGIKTIVETWRDTGAYIVDDDDNFYLSPYISYPDARAMEIEVITHNGTIGLSSVWGRKTFKLKAHKTMNLAICIGEAVELVKEQERNEDGDLMYDEHFRPIYVYTQDQVDIAYNKVDEGMTGVTTDIIDGTDEEWDNGYFSINGTYAADNRITKRDNVLRVSAVDNPFVFPVAQTYRFDADIVGMASNAEAISSGQFGQYPLFVFTKMGIWAMGVDTSGQGAYVSQSPFSREVCNGAVCPVSGGVVFTTDRGVMAISGGEIKELSEALDGKAVMMWDVSKELYEEICNLFVPTIKPVDWRRYVTGAQLAYDYMHSEVWVSNNSYKYSYVYNLRNGRWSIADVVFGLPTNSYPTMVVYNGKTRMTFTPEYLFSNIQNDVLAITRPIKLNTLGYKRLRQAALRGTFTGQLNFYLFGTNDGAKYHLLTGKEHTETDMQRDLVTHMARSKQCKYIVVVVTGTIDGRLSMVEMLTDVGFADNKLK